MGFAIVPVIYSIAEEALANVPKTQIAGSLALGATRWQTVLYLVLLSASPGIFSAVMIGFGRAIGETMIVLMATGNTPILDWNWANGFRTLSANIAVEIPEAPSRGQPLSGVVPGGPAAIYCYLCASTRWLKSFASGCGTSTAMGKRADSMKSFWRGGELFVWMTASGVAISLLMVGAMLGLIMVNGLGQFWPAPLHQLLLKTNEIVIGRVVGQEVIPHSVTPENPQGLERFRYRVGNRDVLGSEYRWINGDDIVSTSSPKDLTFVERREWGPAFGRLGIVAVDGTTETSDDDTWSTIGALVKESTTLRRRTEHLERDEIGAINYRIEKARLERQGLMLDGQLSSRETEVDRSLIDQIAALEQDYQAKTVDVGAAAQGGREKVTPPDPFQRAVRYVSRSPRSSRSAGRTT